MKTFDEIVIGLLAQQQAARELKKELCKEKIAALLKVLEYHEIIELLDEVADKQFAQDEIARYHTEQHYRAQMEKSK